MDNQELLGRVRALRARGFAPKEIARTLGVPPATVALLVRAIAQADHAGDAEPTIVGCWVSPGWSQGLTVEGHPEWPDVEAADVGTPGLVSVLLAREQGRGRVGVCGWLVDVYCLGVKDVVGPRVMDRRRADEFTRSYFAAYQARPLAAPVELARHLVFGAVVYARSLGFAPAAGFEATTGQLGPWTGPSAIGFGRDGKPYFVQGPTTTPQPSWRPWSVPWGGTTFTSSSSAHSRAGRLLQRGHERSGRAAWVLNTYPCRSANDRPSAKAEV